MILIVCGSPRLDRQTNRALCLLEHRLKQNGLQIQRMSVCQLDLPLFGLDTGSSTDLITWRQAVQSASAIVFGSPEYHGSFSGGLKNLLDHLDSTLIAGKPAALVAASGSSRGGLATLSAMRHILRSLHVPAIVEQLAVCPHDRDPSSGDWKKELLAQADAVVSALVKQLTPVCTWASITKKSQSTKAIEDCL